MFGLLLERARSLTAKGVNPICKFSSRYFCTRTCFGACSPITGYSFLMDNCPLQGNIFQFSLQDESELKLIVLDNGAFHKARSLKVAANIVLILLPSYSPKLNPAEKIWAKFKRQFTKRFYETMPKLEAFVCQIFKTLKSTEVKSICGYDYIFSTSFRLFKNSTWY